MGALFSSSEESTHPQVNTYTDPALEAAATKIRDQQSAIRKIENDPDCFDIMVSTIEHGAYAGPGTKFYSVPVKKEYTISKVSTVIFGHVTETIYVCNLRSYE